MMEEFMDRHGWQFTADIFEVITSLNWDIKENVFGGKEV